MKTTRSILILAVAASLGLLVPGRAAVAPQTAGELFEKALYVEEGQGDLQKAIGLYQDILKRFPDNREVAAKAQLHIGLCYEKLGLEEAQKAFLRVINDFPEQKEAVSLARVKLSRLPSARAALDKGPEEIGIRKVWGKAIDSFFMGAPSPDGRSLTYVDWENFANLGLRDLVKGENRLLTDNESWDSGEMCYNSIFSPDGGQVAFAWQTKETLVQLRIGNLDGSSARILHDGKDIVYQVPFGWTADGKQILTVFYGKDNRSRIVKVSVADGSVEELKGTALNLSRTTRMSLSPDGKYIACGYRPREDSDASDIALLSTEGGRETALVEHPADDVVLGWSSDGRQVLFMSDRTGSIGTWSVRVSDGKAQGLPQLVRGDMGRFRPLGMTRDGKLYYGIYTGWSDIFIAPIEPATGNVLASPAKAVRKYETFNSAPDWSPDGQWLVCRSSRGKSAGETPSLLVRSLRTNEVREVNPKKAGGLNFHFIRWSPDGRSVLGVGSDENGKYGALLSIDIQTGETRIIARSDKDDPLFNPHWAPDGKAVYFIRSGKDFRRVMKFDAETGAEKEIFQSRQGLGNYWLALSPDGRELAVAAENKILIISSDGAASRELMENKNLTTIAWMADGKNILYGKLQDGSQDVADLWRVPAAGGEPRKLGLTMSRLMHLRVSPDGKTIAFTASEQPGRSEVWVMENFLPPAAAAREKDSTEFQVRKVWDKALDSYFMGAPSPDGKHLTYTTEKDFLSLGIRDLVRGENRLLLQNKSWADAESCFYSTFSPDGSQVAYAVQAKERLVQLRTVHIDGTSTRILRDGKNGLDYLPFGWTSDGKQILTHFSGREKTSGIAFISALDGSVKQEKALSLNVPWGAKMSLSPDGKYLAGSYLPAEGSANQDIFLLALNGGRESTLVEHPADDVLIGWSPDGGQVLFTSDRTGSVGIWAVRVSEGKAEAAPVFIRGNLGNIHPLGMTRDGRLYYGISTGSTDIFVASLDPATGNVLAPPVKAIRKYETFNSTPDWSPDGQFLACHSSRGKTANESPALLIRSTRTNEVRELIPRTPGGRLMPYYLRWSPDGRSLLGGGRDEKGEVGALHLIDAQTGEAKIIARSDKNDGRGNPLAPDWSPDGKSINFIRIGNEFRRLCRLELETGVEKEISRFPKSSGPFWLASSPDGRQLALRAEGKIRILSRDGAESRELTETDNGTVLAWMPDGKNILYGKAQKGSQSIVELWRVPAAGGEPQRAGLAMSRLSLLRVSPDGKTIAFTGSEQPGMSEIWVMENFLPAAKK